MGVNDFYIPEDSITIGNANVSKDLAFAAKPVYNITISTTGLTTEQESKLSLTFTNLNEEGYTYSFGPTDNITLRDGTYTISYSGLDEYPVKLGLTSNLKVDGADVNKTLAFEPITNWSFDDKAIASGDTTYEGLLFTGTVSSELAKGHLTAKPGATIQVPVNPGYKISITYYYSADFIIAGTDTFSTSSHSTSTLEYADYTYTGTDAGYVTIAADSGASTTYITNISVSETVEYSSVIYVGTDKEYQTINEALTAIGEMNRNDTSRVTVMIDPGNYEEMLVINEPNITLKMQQQLRALLLQTMVLTLQKEL